MSLFQKSVEKKYLNELDSVLIDKKYADFQNYFGNPERQENIRNSKEEQFQEGFLRELFVNILGYTLKPEPDFNLTTELKNISNSKKADGAILKNDNAHAVIELKSTNTTDLDSIETQAFGYKNHHPKCVYIITSNFEKLRFYIQNAVDHIDFDLFKLTKEQFSLLWLCLAKDNLINDLPLKIKDSSVLQEENITKKLYADYSKFRTAIYNNLVKNNPDTDKLLLFKKTQKLLDRFLFIFFAEDSLLVPPNSISQIIEKWKDDIDFGDTKPLYHTFKRYFHVLNVGRPKSGNRQEIFAYNGGLFKPDEILDNILIDDDILHEHTLRLSNYDFDTDVDVNILGHIFEHSLGEIENVQAEIKGEKVDSQKNKRKKDGIFYTPKYITKYIVENTLGKLCNEKQAELKIVDEEYAKGRKNRKKDIVRTLDKKLDEYRNWLLTLTILDPACGSGAFLNQALEFLIAEHRKTDELRAQLFGGAIVFSDITSDILEKNIFGVDLNEESVEIAKLSLWLRTAQKGRKLNTLSNNIKCGNSLIDDQEIAGDKAFNWQNEFSDIFAKGGFDVVIGNPPYGADLKKTASVLKSLYQTFTLSGESYILFIEKSIELLKSEGRLGFIVPDTYLNLDFSLPLREYLLKNSIVESVVLLPAKVFDSATVDTTNLIIQKKNPTNNFYENDVNIKLINKKSNSIDFSEFKKEFVVSTKIWYSEKSFLIQSNNNELKTILKVDKSFDRLGTFAEMFSGIKCYEVGKGNPPQTSEIRDEKPFTKEYQVNRNWLPFFEGKHIERYQLSWNENSWLDYGEWLAAPRVKENFKEEKILIRKIVGNTLICDYISYTSYCNTLLFVLRLLENSNVNYKCLLGILNSRFIGWYYRHKFQISDDDTFPQIMIRDILKFPVPNQNSGKIETQVSNILEQTSQLQNLKNKFIGLVKDNFEVGKISKKLESFNDSDFKTFLIELKKQKVTLSLSDQSEWKDFFEKSKTEINQLQSEIEKTDKEIDQMVYELYGLTEDEIKVVEGVV